MRGVGARWLFQLIELKAQGGCDTATARHLQGADSKLQVALDRMLRMRRMLHCYINTLAQRVNSLYNRQRRGLHQRQRYAGQRRMAVQWQDDRCIV